MIIEVRFPMTCPLRSDPPEEGSLNNEYSCSVMDFTVEDWQFCKDNDVFPEWCPLSKENVIVRKKSHEDIVRNVRKRGKGSILESLGD